MFWILMVYPGAGLTAALTLLSFALCLYQSDRYPIVAAIGCVIIAVGGTMLTTQVARWEARRRGGTGEEGSGPIEPMGPGSAG